MKAWKHFCTINRHKFLVMEGCFRLGLYKQGLLHDLSKYSPAEFIPGCRYYTGYMSPHNLERREKGYSEAWLHHKGHNKHHMEYWIDYPGGDKDGERDGLAGMKIPVHYVVEMFVDRVSACKNYQKEKYSDDSALIYYMRNRELYLLHEDTRALLEYLLSMLAIRGEKETYSHIRTEVLKGKVPYEKIELELRKNAL